MFCLLYLVSPKLTKIFFKKNRSNTPVLSFVTSCSVHHFVLKLKALNISSTLMYEFKLFFSTPDMVLDQDSSLSSLGLL